MRAIITTFERAGDGQAVTLTLAIAGPADVAESDRLHDLFQTSAVIELRVSPAGDASLTLASGRTEER